jgi:hypothetical protein
MNFHFNIENKANTIVCLIVAGMGYFLDKEFTDIAGEILKIVFYSLGITTFSFAIYDWIMLQRRHKQWAEGGFKKEERDKYRIR